MGAFARAIEKLGYEQDEVLAISGIGCSSRMSGYLDFNSLHTAHGRALAFATGAKMAEPRLKVFVIMEMCIRDRVRPLPMAWPLQGWYF